MSEISLDSVECHGDASTELLVFLRDAQNDARPAAQLAGAAVTTQDRPTVCTTRWATSANDESSLAESRNQRDSVLASVRLQTQTVLLQRTESRREDLQRPNEGLTKQLALTASAQAAQTEAERLRRAVFDALRPGAPCARNAWRGPTDQVKSAALDLLPTTGKKVLCDEQLGPAGKRQGPSWPEFLRAQATSVIAVHFFTVDTVWLQRLSTG